MTGHRRVGGWSGPARRGSSRRRPTCAAAGRRGLDRRRRRGALRRQPAGACRRELRCGSGSAPDVPRRAVQADPMTTRPRCAALAAIALLACAAPAGAVVNGTPVEPSSVPWFVQAGNCGGSLIAPDRVDRRPLRRRLPARLARRRRLRRRGDPPLRRRLAGARLAPSQRPEQLRRHRDRAARRPRDRGGARTLGGASLPAQATLLGMGRRSPPAPARARGRSTTRPCATRRCASWATPTARASSAGARGNGGERFDARRMVCGVDADGAAPLYSGCNGDSGGPFYSGTPAAPVARRGQLGRPALRRRPPAVRLHGRRSLPGLPDRPDAGLGPDGDRHRHGHARGHQASADGLPACRRASATPRRGPRRPGRADRGRQHHLVRGKTYTVRRADRGHRVNCRITASNAGGYVSVIARGALIRR